MGVAFLVSGLMLGCTSTGCGSDACQEATEKLESECGYELAEAKDEASCTGEAECQAECYLDACTCEDVDGTLAEAGESCFSCLTQCAAES